MDRAMQQDVASEGKSDNQCLEKQPRIGEVDLILWRSGCPQALPGELVLNCLAG
jgi:hypothetical protein